MKFLKMFLENDNQSEYESDDEDTTVDLLIQLQLLKKERKTYIKLNI